MTPRRGSVVRVRRNTDSPPKTALEKHTQAVLNSGDEGKDNRADRRRLRLLVSASNIRGLVFGRPEEMLTTSWT